MNIDRRNENGRMKLRRIYVQPFGDFPKVGEVVEFAYFSDMQYHIGHKNADGTWQTEEGELFKTEPDIFSYIDRDEDSETVNETLAKKLKRNRGEKDEHRKREDRN